MILDVGCGINPSGDVNVDLKFGANYGVTKTKANLYASVYNLPFKDSSFNIVRFHGLLHHLQHPKQAFKEILRVSSNIVIGTEPNFNLFFPRDKTESNHLYKKRQILEIVKDSKTEVKRTIDLCRLGRVNQIDRTWNIFPLMMNFWIITLK